MPANLVRRRDPVTGNAERGLHYRAAMTQVGEQVVVEVIALDDAPEVKANNPIHGAGAQAAGYERPITAGASNYGWAVPAAIDLLGDAWFDCGWAEFALRRPVFVGDRLRTTATRSEPGACSFVQENEDGKATVEGRAGLGLAPWHGEWQLPTRREPVPAVDQPPLVLPEDVPVDEDLPPMAFELGAAEAESWATVRLGDEHPRYRQGSTQRVHPSWLPLQYVTLVRHSCRQPDVGIHVSGRVQNLRPIDPPAELVLAGRWIMHEQRKERWWAAAHAVLSSRTGEELAYFGQVAILLPPFEL
jgi:hypothetical protein